MVETTINKFMFSLITSVFLINLSETYQIFPIESGQLCSPTIKQNIILQKAELSGAIAILNNMTIFKEHARKWGDDSFICEFRVSAAEKFNGIFAVIQNIVFRKKKLTDECIDYVEYRTVNTRNSFKSRKYCGQSNGINLAPTGNSFVEASTTLDVYINISREPLKPYRKLELEIVFTAFRYCIQQLPLDDQWCGPNYKVYCIYKRFFNDGYVNCPYPGCLDETTCVQKSQGEPYKLGLSAIATVFISVSILVLLYISTWIVSILRRRYGQISNNTSDDCTARQPELMEMNCTSELDTDPPPSYDSLFPPTEQD